VLVLVYGVLILVSWAGPELGLTVPMFIGYLLNLHVQGPRHACEMVSTDTCSTLSTCIGCETWSCASPTCEFR